MNYKPDPEYDHDDHIVEVSAKDLIKLENKYITAVVVGLVVATIAFVQYMSIR